VRRPTTSRILVTEVESARSEITARYVYTWISFRSGDITIFALAESFFTVDIVSSWVLVPRFFRLLGAHLFMNALQLYCGLSCCCCYWGRKTTLS